MRQLRPLAVCGEAGLLSGRLVERTRLVGQACVLGGCSGAQWPVQPIRTQLQRDTIFCQCFCGLLFEQEKIAEHLACGNIDLVLAELVLLVGGLAHSRDRGIVSRDLCRRSGEDSGLGYLFGATFEGGWIELPQSS